MAIIAGRFVIENIRLIHVIKVAVDSIGGGLFQTCVPIGRFVVVSFVKAQLFDQPFHLVVAAGETDDSASWIFKNEQLANQWIRLYAPTEVLGERTFDFSNLTDDAAYSSGSSTDHDNITGFWLADFQETEEGRVSIRSKLLDDWWRV